MGAEAAIAQLRTENVQLQQDNSQLQWDNDQLQRHNDEVNASLQQARCAGLRLMQKLNAATEERQQLKVRQICCLS